MIESLTARGRHRRPQIRLLSRARIGFVAPSGVSARMIGVTCSRPPRACNPMSFASFLQSRTGLAVRRVNASTATLGLTKPSASLPPRTIASARSRSTEKPNSAQTTCVRSRGKPYVV